MMPEKSCTERRSMRQSELKQLLVQYAALGAQTKRQIRQRAAVLPRERRARGGDETLVRLKIRSAAIRFRLRQIRLELDAPRQRAAGAPPEAGSGQGALWADCSLPELELIGLMIHEIGAPRYRELRKLAEKEAPVRPAAREATVRAREREAARQRMLRACEGVNFDRMMRGNYHRFAGSGI